MDDDCRDDEWCTCSACVELAREERLREADTRGGLVGWALVALGMTADELTEG